MADEEKPRFKYVKAMVLAEALKSILEPFCDKIEIAGSLRRKKEEIGDVELVFIPKTDTKPKQDDFFGSETVDLAARRIETMLAHGEIEKRPSKEGKFTWGPKNKLAIHKASGIPIDFFATTPENWWVTLVIRTGSKDTNLRLTNGAIAKGANLMAYGCGIKYGDKIIAATSEEHVFQLCGVPYLEPTKR